MSDKMVGIPLPLSFALALSAGLLAEGHQPADVLTVDAVQAVLGEAQSLARSLAKDGEGGKD